jgi:hypothetical protein
MSRVVGVTTDRAPVFACSDIFPEDDVTETADKWRVGAVCERSMAGSGCREVAFVSV